MNRKYMMTNKMPLKKEKKPLNNKYRKLAKKTNNDAICEFIEWEYYSNILISILFNEFDKELPNNEFDEELPNNELLTCIQEYNFCNDFMNWEIDYLLMEFILKDNEFIQEK